MASLPGMTRVERYERRSDIPMLLLAVAFLVAYAWPVLDSDLDSDVIASLNVLSWAVWAAFAVDFAIRLWLAEDRGRYARRHWYDVALVVLPFLRPMRLLRLLAFARVLNRTAAGSLVGRVSTYVVGVAVISVGLGAVAVLDVEQDAKGANITSFGDALWWACTTVTTVGYGDRFPVTTQGRVIAVALMVIGIAMVGAVTASVAAWMVPRSSTRCPRGTPATEWPPLSLLRGGQTPHPAGDHHRLHVAKSRTTSRVMGLKWAFVAGKARSGAEFAKDEDPGAAAWGHA